MNGLRQQRELELLKVDCGWTVYQKAYGVSGIYAESSDPSNNRDRFSPLLRSYKTLEFPEQDGKIVQITATSSQAKPNESYVSSRTQRYSLIEKSAIVGSFRRSEAVLFDHQTNQVLAKDVEYWPSDSSSATSVFDYAMRVLLVRPDICQSITHPSLNERVAQVAVPAEKKIEIVR